MLQSLLKNDQLFLGTYKLWQYDDKFLQGDAAQYCTAARIHPKLETALGIFDHQCKVVR